MPRRFALLCGLRRPSGSWLLRPGGRRRLHIEAPGNIRRNMPDPIPVVVLGRLAVHADWAGKGIGAGLLKDAILRSLRLADEMGIRALLCHAISDQAKKFYLRHGFIEGPINPMTLLLNLAKFKQSGAS